MPNKFKRRKDKESRAVCEKMQENIKEDHEILRKKLRVCRTKGNSKQM